MNLCVILGLGIHVWIQEGYSEINAEFLETYENFTYENMIEFNNLKIFMIQLQICFTVGQCFTHPKKASQLLCSQLTAHPKAAAWLLLGGDQAALWHHKAVLLGSRTPSRMTNSLCLISTEDFYCQHLTYQYLALQFILKGLDSSWNGFWIAIA